MVRRPVLTVRFQFGKFLFITCLLASLFLMFGGCAILYESFLPPYPDLPSLLGALILVTFSIILGAFLYHPPAYEFGHWEIGVKTFWKSKLHSRDTIKGFREVKRKYRNHSRKKLIFKTSRGYLTFYEEFYPRHYTKIVRYANEHHEELSKKTVWTFTYYHYFLPRLVSLAIAMACLLGSFNLFLNNQTPIEQLALGEIKLHLSESPIKNRYGKRHHKKTEYILRFEEHPGFKFEISGRSYTKTDPAIVDDLSPGDIITLGINKKIRDAKLLGITEPDFWTKHSDWYSIDILKLTHQAKVYLEHTPLAVIDSSKPKSVNLFFLFFGLTFLVFALTPWKN